MTAENKQVAYHDDLQEPLFEIDLRDQPKRPEVFKTVALWLIDFDQFFKKAVQWLTSLNEFFKHSKIAKWLGDNRKTLIFSSLVLMAIGIPATVGGIMLLSPAAIVGSWIITACVFAAAVVIGLGLSFLESPTSKTLHKKAANKPVVEQVVEDEITGTLSRSSSVLSIKEEEKETISPTAAKQADNQLGLGTSRHTLLSSPVIPAQISSPVFETEGSTKYAEQAQQHLVLEKAIFDRIQSTYQSCKFGNSYIWCRQNIHNSTRLPNNDIKAFFDKYKDIYANDTDLKDNIVAYTELLSDVGYKNFLLEKCVQADINEDRLGKEFNDKKDECDERKRKEGFFVG